jgi:hypothetical protein
VKLVAALLLIPTLVFGNGAAGEPRSGIVDLTYATRVLHFDHTRNAISPEGIIAVCFPPNDNSMGKNTCNNAKGENQWQDIFTINIPGYQLVGYEYQLVGPGAYRNLFLYFRRKDN